MSLNITAHLAKKYADAKPKIRPKRRSGYFTLKASVSSFRWATYLTKIGKKVRYGEWLCENGILWYSFDD